MKRKSLFIAILCLLVSHATILCCWGASQNRIDIVFPNIGTSSVECAYSAISLSNEFTVTSFTASKTSLVFKVQWPTNMVVKGNTLDILYTWALDDEPWGIWREVTHIEPAQGMVEFELPFIDYFSWYDGNGDDLPPASFFAVKETSPEPEVYWVRVTEDGQIENVIETENCEADKTTESSPNHEEDVIATSEAKPVEKQNGSHRPLLYAGIVLAFCAIVNFMRKKKP